MIVERDRKMCEHIFVKLYEEDEKQAYQERKARGQWLDTRERFILQHEKNIALENKAKLQKKYALIPAGTRNATIKTANNISHGH